MSGKLITMDGVTIGKEFGDKAYSRFGKRFDANSPAWTKDPVYNKMFLKEQERFADDLLRERGYLFLNEVYDILGIPKTAIGQKVGWVYEPEEDTHVDFGLYDTDYRDIVLDFNCKEGILNKLPAD